MPLKFVIPDERALFRLREGSISAIVALDDRTSHWQKLKKDSVAQIVINTLSHLVSGANICFLKGKSFHLYGKNNHNNRSFNVREENVKSRLGERVFHCVFYLIRL